MLVNICSAVLASLPSSIFISKHLVMIRLKLTSNMRTHMGNIFSSPASLLPSTVILNGLCDISFTSSCLISSPIQLIIAVVFVHPHEKFLAALLSLNSPFTYCVRWSERLKKVLWWTMSSTIFISAFKEGWILFCFSKANLVFSERQREKTLILWLSLMSNKVLKRMNEWNNNLPFKAWACFLSPGFQHVLRCRLILRAREIYLSCKWCNEICVDDQRCAKSTLW